LGFKQYAKSKISAFCQPVFYGIALLWTCGVETPGEWQCNCAA